MQVAETYGRLSAVLGSQPVHLSLFADCLCPLLDCDKEYIQFHDWQ